MSGKMEEVDRAVLRSLVRRWAAGELCEREVHEEAECLWDSRSWPARGEQDDRSVAVEVLAQLEILNHQLITAEDAPAILAFLDTPPGRAADGWRRWRAYWDGIDWDERRRAVAGNDYYIA
jgi:hypothetical protein